MNTEPDPRSTNEFEQTRIEGTPYTIVRNKDEHYVIIGKYRISGPWATHDQAVADTKNSSIERILEVVGIVTEVTVEHQLNQVFSNKKAN